MPTGEYSTDDPYVQANAKKFGKSSELYQNLTLGKQLSRMHITNSIASQKNSVKRSMLQIEPREKEVKKAISFSEAVSVTNSTTKNVRSSSEIFRKNSEKVKKSIKNID